MSQLERPDVRVWEKVASGYRLVSGGVLQRVVESVNTEDRLIWYGVGQWSMRVPASAVSVVTKKRVVTVDARGERFTGLIERIAPQMDDKGRITLEVSGTSAANLLSDVLCYPDPGASADAQLTTRYQAAGPAETVIRDLIAANFTRRGEDVLVDASQGRGSSVRVNLFFANLLSVVQRKANAGGIGVRVGLENTSGVTARMRISFYVPQDRTARAILSPTLGTVASWKQEDNVPTATRANVAAGYHEQPYVIDTSIAFDNILTIQGGADAKHHLKTGARITFRGGGTPPAPLEDATTYYAIRLSPDTFRVAKTRARALRGEAIALTSTGSGVVKVTEMSRSVRQVVNSAAEDEWGRRRETFVDARGDDDEDESIFTDRGSEALKEAAAQSAFELDAADAVGMRYGEHFGLGDRVTVRLLPGLETAQYLGAVRMEAAPGSALKVKLVPGNPDASDPLFRQAAVVRALRQQVRTLEQEEE